MAPRASPESCLAHRAFRGRDALAAPGLLSGHLRRRPRRKMPIRMDPARGPAAQSDPSVQGSQNIEPRSPPYYYLISALACCRIPRRRRRLRRFRRRRFLVAFWEFPEVSGPKGAPHQLRLVQTFPGNPPREPWKWGSGEREEACLKEGGLTTTRRHLTFQSAHTVHAWLQRTCSRDSGQALPSRRRAITLEVRRWYDMPCNGIAVLCTAVRCHDWRSSVL